MFKGLSLFANVGIGETYLKDIGYPIVLANELLKERCEFYRHQNPDHEIIQGDITNDETFDSIIKIAKEKNVNFILATPPCQGMSLLGKQEDHDPRNLLITRVIRAVKEINPEFVLIENVPQMYDTKIDAFGDGNIITIKEYLQKMANELNYEIKFAIFNSADYGTPQHRKRAFTRIYKKNYQWEDPVKQKWITVRESIGDLPSLESEEDSGILHHKAKKHNPNEQEWMRNTPTGCSAFDNKIHFPKTIRLLKEIIGGKPTMKVAKFPIVLNGIDNKYSLEIVDENNKPTGNFKEIFIKDYADENDIKKGFASLPEYIYIDGTPAMQKIKGFKTTYTRMHWDKPSPAITMNNGSIGGQQNVHPGRKLEDGTYSDARVLTHLELFRLMGLPDDWNVPEWASDGLVRKVIGEAIPPKLTREIVNKMQKRF